MSYLMQTPKLVAATGGGGGVERFWTTDDFSRSSAWTAGGYVLVLSATPDDDDAVLVNFNNGNLMKGIDYSISGNLITMLFAFDPVDAGIAAALTQVKFRQI